MVEKPKPSSVLAQQEVDKAQRQFDQIDHNVTNLSMQDSASIPKLETEPQTKLSQKDIDRSQDIYLKPSKSISVPQKFNEAFREQYEFDKIYVKFIAEHKELIGDTIEMWTHPYGGMPAEFWEVPTNKPVWAPRYVAEQIKSRSYKRLIMKEHVITENNSVGQMYGALSYESSVSRLDAQPVSTRRSVFMGADNF